MNVYELLMSDRHEACRSGLNFLRYKSVEKAWKTCERADWMVWTLIELNEFIPASGGIAGWEREERWYRKITQRLGMSSDTILDSAELCTWAGMSFWGNKPTPEQQEKLARAADVIRQVVPLSTVEKMVAAALLEAEEEDDEE